jgi:pentatricopeptide repeat protein
VIDLLAKHHHFQQALDLLNEMRERAVSISAQLILVLIRRYVRTGMSSEASDLFRRMEEYGAGAPEPATLASHLRVLAKKRLPTEAQALVESYKSVFAPDVVLYTTLVHAWCRAGQLDEAERVFAEMKQSGIMPNVYTYTCVIDAMYRAGQVPRAQELLCQMIDTRCPPNTATFNTIMRAHVKAGRSEQVHNQMRQLGCELDIITYNFLIETHCGKGQGNLDAAMKLLAKMVAKGCVPDCHTFNPMFRLVLVLGNIDAAHKLYEK